MQPIHVPFLTPRHFLSILGHLDWPARLWIPGWEAETFEALRSWLHQQWRSYLPPAVRVHPDLRVRTVQIVTPRHVTDVDNIRFSAGLTHWMASMCQVARELAFVVSEQQANDLGPIICLPLQLHLVREGFHLEWFMWTEVGLQEENVA